MAALRYPWEAEPVPVAPSPLPDPEEQPRKRRGRRAAARIHPASPVAPTPQWLYHHLTISGPAETVAAFAVAARGSGVVPWQLDFAAIEEAVFIRAVAQPAGRRNLTIEGCRILARQFREHVEARQARAAALVGRSHAARLTCAGRCRCRQPFSSWVPPILTLGCGWRRTGASPIGCGFRTLLADLARLHATPSSPRWRRTFR